MCFYKYFSPNQIIFFIFTKNKCMPKIKQPPIDKVLSQVSDAVAKYRYDERLTQSALAEKCGVSVPLLYALETKQLHNISMDKLIKLANAIGFNIAVDLKSNQS